MPEQKPLFDDLYAPRDAQKRFSASKISLYQHCPRAYAYRYEEGVKTPTGVRAGFGVVIHKMLEDFYAKRYQSKKTFISSFRRVWVISIKGENPRLGPLKVWEGVERDKILGQYFGTGHHILSQFWDSQQRRLASGGKPPIATEADFSLDFRGHRIVGVMDRVDIHGSRVYVGDYKTDTRCPPKDDLLLWTSTQFTIYHLAIEQMLIAPAPAGRTLSPGSGEAKHEQSALPGLKTMRKEMDAAIARRKRKSQGKNRRPSLAGLIAQAKADDERLSLGSIVYYHVRSGAKLPTTRTAKDYDDLERKLIDINSRITQEDFGPRYGDHCRFCDYHEVCRGNTVPVSEVSRLDKADHPEDAPEGFDAAPDFPY